MVSAVGVPSLLSFRGRRGCQVVRAVGRFDTFMTRDIYHPTYLPPFSTTQTPTNTIEDFRRRLSESSIGKINKKIPSEMIRDGVPTIRSHKLKGDYQAYTHFLIPAQYYQPSRLRRSGRYATTAELDSIRFKMMMR